jgi:GT2 family glycosyltransferase
MQNPKVAIIVCSYNQWILLEKCLKSLKEKTEYKNYKTYLVDDSGTGKIAKEIKKRSKGIKIIINKENRGFSGANNVGTKRALKEYNPDYILLLSDDTEIVEKYWLRKMIEVAEKNEKVGILGCRTIYPDRTLQWFAKKGRIYPFMEAGHIEKSEEILKNQEVPEILGACFLIKKEVIEKIGLLDEKFNPAYGEETDYCYRAAKKGFHFMYVGETEIIHHGASSTKFVDGIWQIKKRNAIRLEWLNYNLLKIVKYTFIHIGSSLLSKNPIKKLKLLIKAYKENMKNFSEIKQKRRERNSWR